MQEKGVATSVTERLCQWKIIPTITVPSSTRPLLWFSRHVSPLEYVFCSFWPQVVVFLFQCYLSFYQRVRLYASPHSSSKTRSSCYVTVGVALASIGVDLCNSEPSCVDINCKTKELEQFRSGNLHTSLVNSWISAQCRQSKYFNYLVFCNEVILLQTAEMV